MDTRRYYDGEVGVGGGAVNTNNAKTDSKHTDSKHADSKYSRKVGKQKNRKVMRGTQNTNKKDKPLARHSRKRGGGYLLLKRAARTPLGL